MKACLGRVSWILRRKKELLALESMWMKELGQLHSLRAYSNEDSMKR